MLQRNSEQPFGSAELFQTVPLPRLVQTVFCTDVYASLAVRSRERHVGTQQPALRMFSARYDT